MLSSLYLIRHGEAAGPEDPPLTLNGQKQIEKIASFLQKNEIHLDCIYHSVKARAKQSANLIGNQLNVQCIERHGLKPNDSALDLFLDLQTWQEKTVALVSHLPFINNLISELVNANGEICDLKEGSTVLLKFEAGVWKMVWIINPSLL